MEGLLSGGFTDIRIKDLDDAASGPSGQGALVRVVLRLSPSAPTAWANYFNDRWQQQFYMSKRHANVFGDKLEIICMPHELESDHLPELKKVIAETNDAYRRYVAKQRVQEETEKGQ